MPCQCGYPDGMSPRGKMVPEGRHSIRIPTLALHICFIILNKPQFGKISMKTTITAGRSSENGGCFAGVHFAGGHDGIANLCKPITAYNFHMRYNNIQICHASGGNMMECFPEGGWFSQGRSPWENHPPEGRHFIMLPPLAWHICFIILNKPHL